jgi:hypothetical protein
MLMLSKQTLRECRKLSFEVPYPEIIIKSVENASAASRGGTK